MTIQEKRQLLHMLLVKNHLFHAKEHVLSVYGTDRIRELSEPELDECIERIGRIAEGKANDNEIKHWRHLCLRAMSKFINTQDWNNVNSFMMNKRVAGKHLYECSLEELKVLHKKINRISEILAKRDKRLRIIAQNN
jgi:hypothetical protein